MFRNSFQKFKVYIQVFALCMRCISLHVRLTHRGVQFCYVLYDAHEEKKMGISQRYLATPLGAIDVRIT